jgi:hypothetical protein
VRVRISPQSVLSPGNDQSNLELNHYQFPFGC